MGGVCGAHPEDGAKCGHRLIGNNSGRLGLHRAVMQPPRGQQLTSSFGARGFANLSDRVWKTCGLSFYWVWLTPRPREPPGAPPIRKKEELMGGFLWFYFWVATTWLAHCPSSLRTPQRVLTSPGAQNAPRPKLPGLQAWIAQRVHVPSAQSASRSSNGQKNPDSSEPPIQITS